MQLRANVFEPSLAEPCLPQLDEWAANVRPGTVLNAGNTICKLANLPEAHQVNDLRQAVERVQADLQEFRDRNRLDQVVVLNVASTEPPFELRDFHQSLGKLMLPQECGGHPVLPASSLYAWATLDLGWPYINFTPSLGASFPAIQEMAEQ